jgi:pimeloyl-ACP methyl ester carboxylesterase
MQLALLVPSQWTSPGGNGHGLQFNNMLALISDSYTCARFDRRQMTNSHAKENKAFNPQQARDIIALIKDQGFEKAIIFGSSLGGILGFQLAIDHPEIVEHLIAHEAPTANLIPEYSPTCEWFLNGPLETFKKSGPEAAWEEFAGNTTDGFMDEGVPMIAMAAHQNGVNF